MFGEEQVFLEQYIHIYIHFKNGYGAGYGRTNYDWQSDRAPRGNFNIDVNVLRKIRTLKDFLDAFKERRLYSLDENAIIDAEKGMNNLYNFYGPDFKVDYDADWYDLGNGTGLPAELVQDYFAGYLEDLEERVSFLNTLDTLCEHSEPDSISISRCGDCSEYEDDIEYVIDLETGEMKVIVEEEEEIEYVPGIDYETARPENE